MRKPTKTIGEALKESLKAQIDELNGIQARLGRWKEAFDRCNRCLGEGVIDVSNGPDDFTRAFCTCEYGRGLERDYRYGE